MRVKYPRSYHLPWSQGATADDKTLPNVEHFHGREVVVTEKLDGENTTIYPDGYSHARSLDSRAHDSQAWVRALAAEVAYNIPAGWRICGENVFALHSLYYDSLKTYFYVFAIYNEHNECLPWSETVEWAALLGLETVPVLYQGPWDEAKVQACYTGRSLVGPRSEGYVVRLADKFGYNDFGKSLAKFVRQNHVLPGTAHWRSGRITPNVLAKKRKVHFVEGDEPESDEEP